MRENYGRWTLLLMIVGWILLRACTGTTDRQPSYPSSRAGTAVAESEKFPITLTAIMRELYRGSPVPRRSWSITATRRPGIADYEKTLTAFAPIVIFVTPTRDPRDTRSSRSQTLTAIAPNFATVTRTLARANPNSTLTALAPSFATITRTPRPTSTPRVQVAPPAQPTRRVTPVPTRTPAPGGFSRAQVTPPPRPTPDENPPQPLINIDNAINIDSTVSFTVQFVLVWSITITLVSGASGLFNSALLSDLRRSASKYPLSLPMRAIQPFYALLTLINSVLLVMMLPLVAWSIVVLWLAINRSIFANLIDLIIAVISTIGIGLMFGTLRKVWRVFRSGQTPSGYYLFPHEAPALWEFVRSVTPVDHIWLSPGGHCKVRGKTLELGMVVLSEMTQGEFKALLHQQSTHLPLRLTNTGSLIGGIRDGIDRCDDYLQSRESHHLYDLVVWNIVGLFHTFYRETTVAAVFLNMVLTDRHVAQKLNQSPAGFESYTTLYTLNLKFEFQQEQHIINAIEQRRPVFNLYIPLPPSEALMAQMNRHLRQNTALQQRRALLECWLTSPCPSPFAHETEPALSLFENGEAMQHTMTLISLRNVNPKLYAKEAPKPSIYYRN